MTTDLQDAKIMDCLHEHYGRQIVEVAFLPSGDMHSAVYRVATEDETAYFLKLRRANFAETSVTVPSFLSECGIRQIIAPIVTRSHQRWAHLDDFVVIVYPFVKGHTAFEVALTEDQWVDFGTALKRIHTAVVPPELSNRVPHETYSPE
jgi:spectinomycin phosphotransferase